MIRSILLLFVTGFLLGCSPDNVRNFDVRNLAKSDIDMVADSHRQALDNIIRQLATKLYKRNPREIRKTPRMTAQLRIQQIMSPQPKGGYPELQGHLGEDAIKLALSEDYQGDRVFALMTGIRTMVDASYNHKQEFFLTDELNQQRLYNSARNLETTAWQLNHLRDAQGKPLIYANGISPKGIHNLSFERLFGKMIALQDMLAGIVADTTHRTIKNVVHSAASMTFLPI